VFNNQCKYRFHASTIKIYLGLQYYGNITVTYSSILAGCNIYTYIALKKFLAYFSSEVMEKYILLIE
jgi:hypothetical protein